MAPGAGRKLLRDTHESTTDPEARLYKKNGAAAAVPAYLGHVFTENRNGLIVDAMVTQSSTTAEREAALLLIDKLRRAENSTLGADKSYQHEPFVAGLRGRGWFRMWPSTSQPEVAQLAYEPSSAARRLRDQPEETQTRGEGLRLGQAGPGGEAGEVARQGAVDWLFRMVAAAHNLLRMRKLIPAR